MFGMLKLLPVGAQIGIAAAAFALITGAATGAFFYIRNGGYNAAIADVASRNKVALDAVRKATTKVKDCYAGGGVWNATRGVCE